LVEIIDKLSQKRVTKVFRHPWFLKIIEAKVKRECQDKEPSFLCKYQKERPV
jgi:hypothetical protein